MAKFTYKKLKRYPGLWRIDGIGTIKDHGAGAEITWRFLQLCAYYPNYGADINTLIALLQEGKL